MKSQLGLFDINRLAELVSVYLNPDKEFTIYKNGEVSKNKIHWFKRLLNIRDEKSIDFIEVIQSISEVLMTTKSENRLVEVLCAEAVSDIIVTNNRSKSIEKLYIAHLADMEFSQKTIFASTNNGKKKENLTIKVIEQPKVVRAQIYDNRVMRSYQSEFIAEAMNQAEKVFVFKDE